jgi:hypothetical protein
MRPTDREVDPAKLRGVFVYFLLLHALAAMQCNAMLGYRDVSYFEVPFSDPNCSNLLFCLDLDRWGFCV